MRARSNGTDGGRTHRRVRVTTSSCDTRPVSTGTCASVKSLWRLTAGSCSTTGGAALRATQRNRTPKTLPTKNNNSKGGQAREGAECRPITRARHRITHLISFQIHYDKIHAQRAGERVFPQRECGPLQEHAGHDQYATPVTLTLSSHSARASLAL